MQTVNFTCGHCGQLMGVNQEFLGQPVRCPHCQQVVLAPAANGPAPALPLPPAEPEEPESIFSPPDAASEDVFGAAPPPQVEVPPEPPPGQWPNPELAAPPPPPPSAESAPAAPPETAAPSPAPAPSWMEPAPDAAAAEQAGGDLAAMTVHPRPRKESGWVIPLLIFPLITYSVLATIALIVLYYRLQQEQERPHPLEMMPDIQGEYPGGKRQGSASFLRLPPVDEPLPDRLRVVLGQSLTVGGLEVTPTKVELRRVWIKSPGNQPDEMDEESLVLFLRLKNVSADFAFRPLDPSFDRQWKEKRADGKPNRDRVYTFLELQQGGRRFFGGPVPWAPKGATDRPRPETVFVKENGREVNQDYHSRELRPGEEMETLICTDHKDHVARALEDYHDGLLWRVQVRRGLVKVRDRDVSATAVIGVEFTAKDIRKPS